MRYIKLFLVGIIGLFIVVTLMSLLLPSEVKVSRAVVINAPTDKVYTQLANFKNWKNWQPMFASNLSTTTYSDSTVTPQNAFCDITYQDRHVHLNMIAIDSISINFLMQSKGEYEIVNTINITPVKADNQIQVEWRALTKLHWYPWDKFYGIFIDKITGDGYEDALNNLKAFTEKASAP